MKLPRRPRPRPTINLSPLIDVVFILLIFVVLVARFVDQERLDVTLPSAAASRPAETDALQVTITADGLVAVEGAIIPVEELDDALLAARRRYRRAVLVADTEASLGAAVDVISRAKLAGFDAVSVATSGPPNP